MAQDVQIFERRIKEKSDSSPFLFSKNGEGLRYNAINEAYLRAWKKAGLYPKFSGTHLMRFAGAQLSRKVCGSLDAAMATTGHKSSRLVEYYSQQDNHDLNKEASIKMQEHLRLTRDKLSEAS